MKKEMVWWLDVYVKEQVYTIFELSPISCFILLSPSLPSLHISPSNVVLIDKQLSPSTEKFMSISRVVLRILCISCSAFLDTCCCWLYWVSYTVSSLFYSYIAFYCSLNAFLVWSYCCLSQCIACCIMSWKWKWCDWSYSRDVSSFE